MSFLLLPGAYAIGHPFVEVGRAHEGFEARSPHALPDVVAHTGDREGDALALQLLDEVQQGVAGAYVNLVHCLCVHKHVLRRRVSRRALSSRSTTAPSSSSVWRLTGGRARRG